MIGPAPKACPREPARAHATWGDPMRILSVLAVLLMWIGPVFARDIAGGRDHPLLGRYQGSEITFYAASDFDDAALLQAPLDYDAILAKRVSETGGPEWRRVQGRVTRIRYDAPAGRSSLEVMANLTAGLAGKGFAPIFDCSDADCFTGSMKDPYLLGWQVDSAQENGRYADHARYLLASLERPQGMVYVALLAGEAGGNTTVFARVVELKPMETGKVVVIEADAMQKSLAASGRVALYGIYFDTNKDVLKPESKPTLDQIAKLLKDSPGLKLIVTGHTDNQGAFDYNVGLSLRRAVSVVVALVSQYGIASDRLTPFGAGMAAPAAPNTTEDGRSKNRRVELVAK